MHSVGFLCDPERAALTSLKAALLTFWMCGPAAYAQLFPGITGDDLRRALINTAKDAINKPADSATPDNQNKPAPPVSQSTSIAPIVSAPTIESPSANRKISDKERKVWVNTRNSYGNKFQEELGQRSMLLSNPYMDPLRTFFSTPVDMQCAPNGDLLVASSGGFNKEGQTTLSGWWKLDTQGALAGWALNDTTPKGSQAPYCDAPLRATFRQAAPFVARPEGDVLVLESNSVLRLNGAGHVELLSGPRKMCREYVKGLNAVVDGNAEDARFNNSNQRPTGALDGAGNLWISDNSYRALRMVDTRGNVSTIIGNELQSDAKVPPADRITFTHMVWDPVNREMVTGGDFLTPNQLYTTIWRIKTGGTARRVMLGLKLGKSPAGFPLDGIHGLALDAKGRVVFASRNMQQDAVAIFRLDEAKGTVVQVTGQKLPTPPVPIPAEIDGPAERAYFHKVKRMCFSGDSTLFILDDVFIRRLDSSGKVSTWAF